MRLPDFFIVRVALVAFVSVVPVRGGEPASSGFGEFVQPFLEEHCTSCHGSEKQKGKLALHEIHADFASLGEAEKWRHVLEMLEEGEMPPEDEARPDAERAARVRAWIVAGLETPLEGDGEAEGLGPQVRRLTNAEYHNTMRDLLGVELNYGDNLNADPVVPYRFRNTAEFMMVGTSDLQKYWENATRAMASVIVSGPRPEMIRLKEEIAPEVPDFQPPNKRTDEVLPRIQDNILTSTFKLPRVGDYVLRIVASAVLPDGVEAAEMRVADPKERVFLGTRTVANNVDDPQVYEFRGRLENIQVDTREQGGMAATAISINEVWNNGDEAGSHKIKPFSRPRLVIESMEIQTPAEDVWPPACHSAILFSSPLRESDEGAYVREVLKRFMTRAYRRPVAAAELARLEDSFATVRPTVESFDEAMRETLAMVLVSPGFLLRNTVGEAPAPGSEPDDHQLASRLSYFLWSSMPDAELFELATRGELGTPEVLSRQVARMLDDPKASDFVRDFTSQWLSLGKLREVSINDNAFPPFIRRASWDRRLLREDPFGIRYDLEQETLLFVEEILRENLSLIQFLDSDFLMLNENLAWHYGIEGVRGRAIRPVKLPEGHHLGGLLTQGSILIGNSNGTAPHPIYRGVWVREAILGDEVKDPPSNVPSLVGSEALKDAPTIKEALVAHRTMESCNDCHARIDPYGLPFEQHNAIGRYQPKVIGEGVAFPWDSGRGESTEQYLARVEPLYTVAVDASSRLPDGTEVEDMAAFKNYLVREKSDVFARTMIGKLLAYGMNRQVGPTDREAAARLFEQSKAKGHRFRDLVMAICTSELFRQP